MWDVGFKFCLGSTCLSKSKSDDKVNEEHVHVLWIDKVNEVHVWWKVDDVHVWW